MSPSNMDRGQGDENGPDASSLRPVSSLRARFENINQSEPLAVSSKPPSRPISPAPKPDKLRDFKLANDVAPPTPTTPEVPARPKERPRSTIIPPAAQQEAEKIDTAPASLTASTRPPVAPKPKLQAVQTPAVTVQPPQSPPKGKVADLSANDHSSFLNPDAVISSTAANTSPKPVKPPSRTTSPTPAPPPRSPRPSSKPPSPPPPRRSGEFRRDKVPPPPPAPRRGDKTLTPIKTTFTNTQSMGSNDVSQETSPFNSPPGSPRGGDNETPPQLPTRPRPEPRARPASTLGAFEPPPVHHAVARRRDRASETNGTAGYESHAQKPMDPPSRPLSVNRAHDLAHRPVPRPIVPVQHTTEPPLATIQSKRVSSSPNTQSQLHPSQIRTHGRSQTVDSTPERAVSSSYHGSQTVSSPVVAATRQTQPMAPPPKAVESVHVTAFPDGSSTNRRPPLLKKGVEEISTKYDPRIFDICGEFVCTSGQFTRVWNIMDGDQITSLAHSEGTKATAVAFKPAASPEDEGAKLWIGLSSGEIMEAEVATNQIIMSKGSVHGRHEVIRIYRHYNELWTMDDLGNLLVWGPDETGVPNVESNPHQSFKLPKNHSFSMVVGDELWHATGKEIRVFLPTLDGRTQFQVLIRPLQAEGAGEVTSGTLVKTQPGKVFFGHSDGKISIYSTKDYSPIGLLNISTWKMNSLAGVGHRIWVGYNTGRVCVYDMGETPWVVLKEWQAHTNPVISMKSDPASAYRLDRSQVVSLGADNKIKVWDGLLEDDWLEDEMKSKDTTWCDFEEIRALVLTWNAGASTPHGLRYSSNDGEFFPRLLQNSGSPEILVFGFQELVDLEDKTATAKRFLKVKKKESSDQERMAHQYRDWRDYLIKTLDDYMPANDLYHLLHTAPMVGLFTCVFVKSSIRDRIHNLSGAEVKRGMGGLHGNKGAVTVRFQVDDTSLCFINCHLAAGQTQTSARNNDVAEILEASLFPPQREFSARLDSFSGGGDGSMVLDHELCILNGDLNYRIDTMSRDTVVGAVKQNNLGKLLDRDQLLVARRRNPAFRLRAFEELPITFAPTYKYDVGTDNYDTSEKKRSPAWCDRLLFRGRGRVQQLDYRRHEIRTSDHRPVTGTFSLWVKKVKTHERAAAWIESQRSFEAVRERETANEKLHYLTKVCGYDDATSRSLAKDSSSKKVHRSSSRPREGY